MSTGRKHIFKLLSSNGDGTGTVVANGDYSITPLSLRLKLAGNFDAVITRMIVKIQDTGSFDANKYGNNITLTNGIMVYVRDQDDNILEELTMYPIKTSGDWAGHCHDATLHPFGIGDEILTVRWTFEKSGAPIILNFSEGQYLEVFLNDNFTGLVDHKFGMQGYFKHENYE